MEENNIIEQELSKTKKPRKKFWLIIWIVIALGAVSITYIIIGNPFLKEPNLININPSADLTFEQTVCSQIRGIPTWINNAGIIDEGYTNFNNSDPKIAVDLLINANVSFVYHSNDDICKNQIGYFGLEWKRYVDSGYTINCKNVL